MSSIFINFNRYEGFLLFCLDLAESSQFEYMLFSQSQKFPAIISSHIASPAFLFYFIILFYFIFCYLMLECQASRSLFLLVSSNSLCLCCKFSDHNLALFQPSHAKTFILLFKPCIYIFVLQSEKLFLPLLVFFINVCFYLSYIF